MSTELIATPKIIQEAFNQGFIKMENGNFLVPRGINDNKGHFNLTSDLEVCGIVGHEIKARDFNSSNYKDIKVSVSYAETNNPRMIDNAPTTIYTVDLINKQINNGGTTKEDKTNYRVEYNLHKDGTFVSDGFETLEEAEIGIRFLKDDGYNPKRKYK